jgi:hypothetical protein
MSSIIRATTTSGLQIAPDNSGSLQLQTNGTTTAVTIDASQNVGIGTTSPAAKLHTVSSTAYPARIESTGSTYSVIAYKGTGSSANLAEAGAVADAFYIGTNGAERMRIDSSGNVLIGATSQVQVGRFCVQTDLNTYNGMVINDTGSAVSVAYAYFSRSATTKGSITYNSGSNLVAYNTSSDYRLKENIVDLPNGLDAVLQLKPRQFDWKENGNTTTGFIAHELAEVSPHAVTGTKDEVDKDGKPVYQGVDTSFLVATLTAAIQEQQTIINDLKARIETLEAK